MRRIKFSEAVKQALHYERFRHPHPRVQLKMEVVWLKSQGLTLLLTGFRFDHHFDSKQHSSIPTLTRQDCTTVACPTPAATAFPRFGPLSAVDSTELVNSPFGLYTDRRIYEKIRTRKN
jgi:hypothetical protein